MVAHPTLDAVFIDPALAWLKLRGTVPRFSERLRGIGFEGERVTSLDFGDHVEKVGDAAVILAVPPWVAADLVPDLPAPDQFCAILNVHFAVAPPASAPRPAPKLSSSSRG